MDSSFSDALLFDPREVIKQGSRKKQLGRRLLSMKYIFQKKPVFHKTMLMQISGFLSYQETKSADQLFDCEFNTEKSDGSVAVAVKEVSDSRAAAVCLT